VFQRSGWFRDVDGKLRKEIPDIGAYLVPTGKVHPLGDEYLWQHPAGNIHQVYDIPPVVIGPFREHRETIRQGVDLGKRNTAEYNAAMATYRRSAGEIEAKNVETRLFNKSLYAKHPRETAANVPPENQIVRGLGAQRRIVDDAYLRGYFKPPWD
jgi:hypothetical protein